MSMLMTKRWRPGALTMVMAGIVIVCGCLTGVGAAAAQESSLAAACWTPEQLSGSPEERAKRNLEDGDPVTRAPRRELQSFTPTDHALYGSIRRVHVTDGRKLVALTFDLCEAGHELAGYDAFIIDTLRAENVKATFFAGGRWMMDHVERAEQLMSDPLFEIGNHNWSHANVRRIDETHTVGEIVKTQLAYEEVRERLSKRECVQSQAAAMSRIPQRLGLYRFPYGACNPEALAAVAAEGLLAIQWDVSMADPSPSQTAERILKEVLAKVRPGSIIIGHANGRGVHTDEALPTLIAELKKRGYDFVTVSELLAAGKPEITPECYDEHPGDVNRYDTPQSAGKHLAKPDGPAKG